MTHPLANTIWQEDCLGFLPLLDAESVDAIITDPPYGLSEHRQADVLECLGSWVRGEAYLPKKKGFMGKGWDAWVPGPELWKECLRVLKPGGYAAIFAGTRSADLMGMAVRLAGFEVRDSIGLLWVQGQGFPKSLDVSKAIDRELGAERERVRYAPRPATAGTFSGASDPRPWIEQAQKRGYHEAVGDEPITAEAARWKGWGTALKPAWEPILLVRKPLEGTVAENVLRHGTGGLNVDSCRLDVADMEELDRNRAAAESRSEGYAGGISLQAAGTNQGGRRTSPQGIGRWPANLVLVHAEGCLPRGQDEHGCVETCPIRLLNEQSGADTARFFYTAQWANDLAGASLPPDNEEAIIRLWNNDHVNTADGSSTFSSEHVASVLSDAVTWASLGEMQLSGLQELSTSVTPKMLKQLCASVIAMTLRIEPRFLPVSFRLSTESFLGNHVSGAAQNAQIVTTTITIDRTSSDGSVAGVTPGRTLSNMGLGGVGSPRSRLWYCAKAPTSERWGFYRCPGCGLTTPPAPLRETQRPTECVCGLDKEPILIAHPTQKPLSLMRWLCRLITPPAGLILDPFAGSGSTLLAARSEGFCYIGIERDADYFTLLEARLEAAAK